MLWLLKSYLHCLLTQAWFHWLLPTGMVPLPDEMNDSVADEIDEQELKEMAIKVKKGEDCLSWVSKWLPTMTSSGQDMGTWDTRSGAGR